MRSVTYQFAPGGRLVDTDEWSLADCAGRLEAIQHVHLLDDGSAVARAMIAAGTGDLGPRLAELDGIYDVQTADAPDGTLVQLHVRPGESLATLFRHHRSYAVVIDFPIEVVDPREPTLRLVATGHVDQLKRLIEDSREIGAVTIEEVGSYDPPGRRLFAGLTERQQQVLRTALDRGYYDVPRDVTYEDIARDLDCSASTVGQHLRRIEATVLSAIAPCEDDQAIESAPVQ